MQAIQGWIDHGTTAAYLPQNLPSTVVSIPDANLEAAIRSQLGKPTDDITSADMAMLTRLWGGYAGIVNLTGLEYATNLQDLYLYGNQIGDVAPLADLTQLRGLWLNGNQIGDVTPLAGMTQLTDLGLGSNRIGDVAPLADLTQLKRLWLNDNQISDVTPLTGLSQLTWIDVSYNSLDVALGSPSMSVIQSWLDQGANVTYLPQNAIDALLTIAGSDGDDIINVTHSDEDVLVSLNGVVTTYRADVISSVLILCGDGNDWAVAGPSIPRVVIYGGAGDDTLTGGDGNDTLYGEAGNDLLRGGPGIDSLHGGLGDDTIYADGEDTVQTGGGNDTISPDRNVAPTNLALSNLSVMENHPVGTVVGVVGTTDANVGDTFTYELVSGMGGEDNAAFTIVGSELKTSAQFDYEARNSYAIRIRATDAGGLSYEGSFTVTVTDDTADLRGQFGRINGKAIASVPLQDADGDRATFVLSGGGSGEVYGVGNTFEEIVLTGTTAKSVLTIKIKKGTNGDGQATIGSISSDGLLKHIKASKVILAGQVHLNRLNQAPDTAKVSLRFLQLRDASIEVGNLPIASLRLLDWQDTDGTADQLTAPAIGLIAISGRKGDRKTSVSEYLPGDLDASLTVAGGIGSIKVAGNIAGTIRSGKDAKGSGIRLLTAGGNVSGATIVTSGSIGKFRAAALLDSDILVGVPGSFAGQVAGRGDFIHTDAKLGRLMVKGRKLPAGQSHPAYVQASHISAPSVGTVSLLNVAYSGDPLVHVLHDTGVLKVSQTKLMDGTMFASGTWQAPASDSVLWEVL